MISPFRIEGIPVITRFKTLILDRFPMLKLRIEGIPLITRFKTTAGMNGLMIINGCIEGIPLITRFKTVQI